jgi:hypothetical protein
MHLPKSGQADFRHIFSARLDRAGAQRSGPPLRFPPPSLMIGISVPKPFRRPPL